MKIKNLLIPAFIVIAYNFTWPVSAQAGCQISVQPVTHCPIPGYHLCGRDQSYVCCSQKSECP